MLGDLDRVAWGSLTHAFGTAEDVPVHLRALLSADPEERDHGLGELWNTICHQGSVYSASGPAVPFLVDVACAPSFLERARVLDLIIGLGGGLGVVNHWGPDALDHWAPRTDVEREARRAVTAAVTRVMPMSTDGDPEVRAAAITLAGLYAADRNEALGSILPRLDPRTEPEPAVRIAAARAATWLSHTPPPAERVIVALQKATLDASAEVAVAAAFGLRALGEPLRPGLFEVIRRGLLEIQVETSSSGNRAVGWFLPALLDADAEIELTAALLAAEGPGLWGVPYTADRVVSRWRRAAARLVPLLGRLLDHEDGKVRRAACSALTKCGNARRLVADGLAARLDDADDLVRKWTLDSLVELGDPRVDERVVRALAGSRPSPTLVAHVRPGAPGVDRALRSLLDTVSPESLPFVARALLRVGGDSRAAIPHLTERLGAPRALEVLIEIVVSLPHGLTGPDVDGLAARLRDVVDQPMRFPSALWAEAERSGGSEAWRLAHEAVDGEAARAHAVALLARLEPHRATEYVAVLERVLAQRPPSSQRPGSIVAPTDEVARSVARAVTAIGPAAKALIPSMWPLLDHPDAWARLAAGVAVWKVGADPARTVSALARCLSMPGGQAFECLAEIGDGAREAVPRLREIVESERRIIGEANRDDALVAGAARALAAIVGDKGMSPR